MYLDAAELNDFYARTRLGRFAGTTLGDRVDGIWPDLKGLTLAAFGFPLPLLARMRPRAERAVALMPGQQGVVAWPGNGLNVSVLTGECDWPLHDSSADRILLLHGLEASDNPAGLLEECWRVLDSSGRLLVIVPNRAGLWARRDATPFGYGRPYSAWQLESELSQHRFETAWHGAALFAPPSDKGFWHRAGPAWERFGCRTPLSFAGGVILLEATKRVLAPHKPPLKEAVKRRLRGLEEIAAPVPKPVSGRMRRKTAAHAENERENLPFFSRAERKVGN
ncbi:MAG: methyltransferase domain-containing protein [Albidovulum sp.]|nr:methyltransferase domain-containing protein [Albidovulum sp.]MDE0534081.1 methyltransferase domain-containing protein [Albidovulum sp.]